MRHTRTRVALAGLALAAALAPAAHARTTVNGVFLGAPSFPGDPGFPVAGDGYDATDGDPRLITGVSFTGGSGIIAGDGFYDTGTDVIVTGGAFTGGLGAFGGQGFSAGDGATVAVTGGTFTGGFGLSGGGVGLYAGGGAITVYGTSFSDTPSGGATTTGFRGTVPPGAGSFTWTLQGGGSARTVSYFVNSGSLTLSTAPFSVSGAPEPSEWAALGFTGLGIGGLLIKARRRKAVARP